MSILGAVEHLAGNLQEHGCSLFFFTSAMQSAFFGEKGRQTQAHLIESNLEFKERMRAIKDDFQRERLDEQLAFRRESYELGKQYMLQQTAELNVNRQKEIDFQFFCESYWPLNTSPFALIQEQRQQYHSSAIIPIRILVAQTEVSAFNRRDLTVSYDAFCNAIINGLRNLPNVVVESRPWKKGCQSTYCEAMNVNFIMQGIPTVIIFPYQIGNTFGIEIAAWTFLRGNRSMLQSKILSVPNFKATERLEETYSAVRAVAGMTRDAYMLNWYHAPVVFPQLASEDKYMLPETRIMLEHHYASLRQLVTQSDEYKQLCTPSELADINRSLEAVTLLKR